MCIVIQSQEASEKLASSLLTGDNLNPHKFVKVTKTPANEPIGSVFIRKTPTLVVQLEDAHHRVFKS